MTGKTLYRIFNTKNGRWLGNGWEKPWVDNEGLARLFVRRGDITFKLNNDIHANQHESLVIEECEVVMKQQISVKDW